MGYTEPPHKDRKGKLKSYWNSDELLFYLIGVTTYLPYMSQLYTYQCVFWANKHHAWDPGTRRRGFGIHGLPAEVRQCSQDLWRWPWRKVMERSGFPMDFSGKMRWKWWENLWGLWYVPYKGIPKFINLCWGWFMIGFTTWFRHRWCWNPFPTATRGRRFFHLGMGLLILSTFLQSLPQNCFCIGTYIYIYIHIHTLHYITLHTYIPHKYIYI